MQVSKAKASWNKPNRGDEKTLQWKLKISEEGEKKNPRTWKDNYIHRLGELIICKYLYYQNQL